MSTVEIYKQIINEKIAVELEKNKLEYLVKFAVFNQLEESPLILQDIYFSKVVAAKNSDFYNEFTSLTHVYSVGTQTFVFECLMENYSFEFFHPVKYEPAYYDQEGISFDFISNKMDECPLFVLAETLLTEAIPEHELENLFNEYYSDIISEQKLSKLLPLSTVQQIFPNVQRIEAHTLDISRLYIQENIYIDIANSELFRTAVILQQPNGTGSIT